MKGNDMKMIFSIVTALELHELECFIKSQENNASEFNNKFEPVVTIPKKDGVKVNKIANTTFEVVVEIDIVRALKAKPENPIHFVEKVISCVKAFVYED